jgi:hypothetical protein
LPRSHEMGILGVRDGSAQNAPGDAPGDGPSAQRDGPSAYRVKTHQSPRRLPFARARVRWPIVDSADSHFRYESRGNEKPAWVGVTFPSDCFRRD